ncbi:phosphoribosylaminoimidazolesuccinocarboxamide synthase [Candidatus Peregrinibacteria bacterium]|jgi:phosphoribosylaminoimidazole-succinocarboxamide synthase|nr:phosphoribosylaminoimidazolesuccinocarboxamide synthase [Candidatus Peregrinibacteria bacterium]MBT4631918.1 phosphoribosylaminoimidazolesuccinocarboxamide synthase [Candidatus Peregrinibacteria bacterium]MBT5516485.1 phosphoribosylaminoimidazolesuccinocarboxamide synthase [Candidatus Peregrinibacteria bacterium]MBT5824161.1 phosphoribosylaminoimidazolesuccinocarboxamide synthase [Candidatus Peregrinibacteria bacterium]
MIDPKTIAEQIKFLLSGTNFANLGTRYEGKVRDNYTNGDRRILITTDRLSAFDRIIALVPFKGEILNGMTKFWFEQTKDICPNYVESYPDPSVIIGKECEPLKVEMVIRAYITGTTTTSAWYNYSNGSRNICGNELPDGLVKNQKLPEVILTPTTKGDHGDHDKNMTPEEIVERGLITQEEWDKLADYTRKLFARGQELADKNGVILVDTKYEFGKDANGEIMLIDEIHTPDSSRYWIKDTYEERMAAGEEPENINKEFLRIWLAEEQGYRGEGVVPEVPEEMLVKTAEKYMQAFELITGQPFVAEVGDTHARIEKNLTPYYL